MATGSKAGLYQNAQSAFYLPPTLVKQEFAHDFEESTVKRHSNIHDIVDDL